MPVTTENVVSLQEGDQPRGHAEPLYPAQQLPEDETDEEELEENREREHPHLFVKLSTRRWRSYSRRKNGCPAFTALNSRFLKL